MKKFLPKTSNNPQGFTLIELLVVISIIAILAVIGISVYSGAQGSARDGQRRSEISSIAKSIESSKNYSNSIQAYKYLTTDGANDFPRGFPADPSGATRGYCIYATATANVTQTVATSNSATPPTCATLVGGVGTFKDLTTSMSTTTTGNLGATTPDVRSWTICANLERSATPYCIFSLSK